MSNPIHSFNFDSNMNPGIKILDNTSEVYKMQKLAKKEAK